MMMRIVMMMMMMVMSSYACPTDWPVLDDFRPSDLVGNWYDVYSTRWFDGHLATCTEQSVSGINETTVFVHTTTRFLIPEIPALSFKFVNVLKEGSNNIFRLVPNNTLASSFGHNSTFGILDWDTDKYVWIVCNGTPEYEIHINSRPDATVSDEYIQKVNKLIEAHNLDPKNSSWHKESHPSKCK